MKSCLNERSNQLYDYLQIQAQLNHSTTCFVKSNTLFTENMCE
jgi:hypothetical protein